MPRADQLRRWNAAVPPKPRHPAGAAVGGTSSVAAAVNPKSLLTLCGVGQDHVHSDSTQDGLSRNSILQTFKSMYFIVLTPFGVINHFTSLVIHRDQ